MDDPTDRTSTLLARIGELEAENALLHKSISSQDKHRFALETALGQAETFLKGIVMVATESLATVRRFSKVDESR